MAAISMKRCVRGRIEGCYADYTELEVEIGGSEVTVDDPDAYRVERLVESRRRKVFS